MKKKPKVCDCLAFSKTREYLANAQREKKEAYAEGYGAGIKHTIIGYDRLMAQAHRDTKTAYADGYGAGVKETVIGYDLGKNDKKVDEFSLGWHFGIIALLLVMALMSLLLKWDAHWYSFLVILAIYGLMYLFIYLIKKIIKGE